MTAVILSLHIILAIALIGVILIQRSEGGGLGIGGGGGVMTSRGAANLLTRVTTWLGGAFMATSLLLAILAGQTNNTPLITEKTIMEKPAIENAPSVPISE